MNRYKTLQEKAKAKGKLLLVESVSYIPKQDDVVILTDSKLTESINGKQYECRGILKNVPVTRYTENANGRVYSEELWRNVEKQGMFEGSDVVVGENFEDSSVDGQVIEGKIYISTEVLKKGFDDTLAVISRELFRRLSNKYNSTDFEAWLIKENLYNMKRLHSMMEGK